MNRHTYGKTRARRGAARAAAGMGALALIAVTVSIGSGAAADQTRTQSNQSALAAAQVAAADEQESTENPEFEVKVGKSVAVTADASGAYSSAAVYSSTGVAGDGAETITVPMGPNRLTNLSSVEPLQTEGDAVVYDLTNSGDQVQQLVVGGGNFPKRELAATVEVVVKVDGEVIDPSTYDSITGNAEVSYKIINHTASEETIKYVDASGAPQELKTTVAIPFAVHIDVTYGAGWGNIYAPFANGGMSAGQTLSGDTSLGVSASDSDPDGVMTLTARAEDAQLPKAVISITPKDTGGAISTKESLADTGAGLDEALNGKAVPMLVDAQRALGEVSVDIDDMLTEKLNPVLNDISKLNLDSDEMNEGIAEGSDTIAEAGSLLFGVNTTLNQAGVLVVGLVDGIVSEESQAQMVELSNKLAATDESLSTVIPILEKAAKALKKAGPALGVTVDELVDAETGGLTLEEAVEKFFRDQGLSGLLLKAAMDQTNRVLVQTTHFGLYCPEDNQGNPCLGEASIGVILDTWAVQKLDSTCTTGFETADLWSDPKYKLSLQKAIADATDPAEKGLLGVLLKNLDTQESVLSGENERACVRAAERTQDALKGLFSELGTVGDGLDDLLPLLRTLQKSLAGTSEGIADFAASMPETRAELNRLNSRLTVLAVANGEGAEVLDGVTTDLVVGIEPVVTDLSQIVNLLAAAAPDLEETLGLLPQLVNEIAYGNIGAFVTGLTSLGDMGAKLSDGASAAAAVNGAVDKRFQSGAGFPYGAAEGPTVGTSAVYTWELAGPEKATASTGERAAFAIVLLLIGAVGGTLLARRSGGS